MNKIVIIIIILITGLMFVTSGLLSHGGEDHSNTKTEQVEGASDYVMPGMDEFPSLHPLVVHFPIVLFLLAPALWIFGMWKKDQSYLTLAFFINSGGLLAALIAAKWLHPHTTGLSSDAQATLDLHDLWADWTLNIAYATTILMGCAIWIKRYAKVTKSLALVFAISTAVCVSITGHFGAALTYVYGVGAQGQFLELESHDDHDKGH